MANFRLWLFTVLSSACFVPLSAGGTTLVNPQVPPAD